MIYAVYGSEYEKARLKARELVSALQKKKPDALLYRITSLDFSEHSLPDLVGGQGLFESKYIVFFDSLFESKEIKTEVVSVLSEIAASDNVFIFLEKELDKKTLGEIEKHSAKVQVFDKAKKEDKKEFNVFALSDALLSRDKKKLWALLMEAKKKGGAPEEIHGTLWWQIKSLQIARVSKTAEEAELSPFVFSKAKRAEKMFSDIEMTKIMKDFVEMYHDAHRGIVNLWGEMEKWVLKL